ncbi:MAG: tryptophan synthase subunit alpha [Alphaproteobacteria bacterium]|nr:tryptophan synthase subunit alpha [Alphaproteobacteria bacterium]
MSRIERTFKSLKRPALITFITAGDPDYETSLAALKILPGAGADIVELGMPFTDPAADGPVIQRAGQRALAAGGCMKQTLSMVREFRKDNGETPLVLMGYANPVLAYGPERFCQDAAESGVDGLIIVDLPPEEADLLAAYAKAAGLDIIRLVTPVTDEARLEKILEGASGFLYYVSITGVTGTAQADPAALKAHIERIRARTDLPVVVGFGIRTPQDVAAMGEIADGVVVGSAIVENFETMKDRESVLAAIRDQIAALA